MIVAGVKELKNALSRYLDFVKNGEDLLITERGKVIARIIAEHPEHPSLRNDLLPLVKEGLVSLPKAELKKKIPPPVAVPGRDVSDLVVEDRR